MVVRTDLLPVLLLLSVLSEGIGHVKICGEALVQGGRGRSGLFAWISPTLPSSRGNNFFEKRAVKAAHIGFGIPLGTRDVHHTHNGDCDDMGGGGGSCRDGREGGP